MLTSSIKKSFLALGMCSSLFFISCQKGVDNNDSKASLQLRLTDSPNPDVREVWVDIRDVQISYNDTSMVALSGVHPGVYNLLDLTNGRDTLLADADIPAGNIGQIRLILGDNNYIITNSGERIPLRTPSAQQSGLKVKVNQTVTGGMLYRLVLDFDAARSVVKAGNSGNYNLKPVIRVLTFLPSGGSAKGVVTPANLNTAVYAIQGMDTAAGTFTNSTGNWMIRDIAAGNYTFSFVPADTTKATQQKIVNITLGQTTVVDTLRF
ncbi:MAG: DUF4382 domain-containing protein [Ferruginibacter sp.]